MSTTTTTTTADPKAEKTTTTTTTVDPADNAEVTANPTLTPQGEKRGEVAVDQGAEAAHLKEQTQDERLDQARSEALRNHDLEHANDAQTNDGDPTSYDKESE